MKVLSTKRIKTQITGIKERGLISSVRQRGDNWMRVRLKWFRANPLCVSCESNGLIVAAEELDHIVPLFKGGADDESNYQSLCVPCHKEKTRRDRKT